MSGRTTGQGTRIWTALAVMAAGLCGLAAAPAAHATPPDAFALGESQNTHDQCDARADDHDKATQMKGAQAWRIQCRGYTSDFGRLYVYEDRRDAPPIYNILLDVRARCGAPVAVAVPKLGNVTRRLCVAASSGQPYVVYRAVQHGAFGDDTVAIGEGLQQISDTVANGVVIALGKAPAPPASPLPPQAADETDPHDMTTATRTELAYQQNQSWRFSDAATRFSALALDESLKPEVRADAYLNWALNESNSGRFDNAAHLFDAAHAQIDKVGDPVLEARGNNYEALDARNRGDLTVAVQKARAALAYIVEAHVQSGTASTSTAAAAGGDVIDPNLAASLNGSASLGLTEGLLTAQKLDILAAQSWYIIGSCLTETGDYANAHEAIANAEKLFSSLDQANNAAAIDASTPFLKAQVINADARLARLEGNKALYLERSTEALAALRKENDFSGMPVEGEYLLEKGRAEAENGLTQKALVDFNNGLKIFRDTRGSLGASADVAESYFDLLLTLRRQDSAKAAQYDELFFAGMQSVVDVTTADTVKRLYASLSSGSSDTAAKARQFEDTRRRLALARTEQQSMIDAGTYAGDARTRVDSEINGLQRDLNSTEQQLVSLDPKYGQLVSADATVADVRGALNPGEVYAKIVLLSDRSYGLVVSRDQVIPYRIDLGRDQVAATVAKLREPFDSDRLPVFNVPMSHDLFTALFGPGAATVAAAQHLIYEPDSALFGLPAGVFVTDGGDVPVYQARFAEKKAGKFNDAGVTGGMRWLSLYDGVSWLGRKTDITLTVAASGFIQARKAAPSTAPKSFLGFAAPVTYGVTDPRLFSLVTASEANRRNPVCVNLRQLMVQRLVPLPGTAEVVQAVARQMPAGESKIYIGPDFTDSGIDQSTELHDYRIVFFGTHGLLPMAGGCLPEAALVTSLGSDPSSDGLLSVSEIFNLKLNADLVVLAACDTGRSAADTGDATADANGGALDGLARAFIFAGARNLVVSHWQIPTVPTTRLMTAFFSSGRASQSDSLRQAQLQLMNDPAYAHPYYWAFFSVVGDGSRPIPGL